MQISHSKRVLNLQNFLPKHPFSMGKETNQVDVESICVKVTKHTSKKVARAEVNLN